MNKQPGAQFEILVDGKPRSYRDTKSGAMDAVQEPTAAQRGCGERPTKRSADRGGCSRVMTRFEQRSDDAIAFMAASVVA
jgi:hypothetical protein